MRWSECEQALQALSLWPTLHSLYLDAGLFLHVVTVVTYQLGWCISSCQSGWMVKGDKTPCGKENRFNQQKIGNLIIKVCLWLELTS